MPGPHRRSPPPPPMISRRSPTIRRRMRSPVERLRPAPSGPLGQIRPSDYRVGPIRRSRSRSPIDKSRSMVLTMKRTLSPKHGRRPSPISMRKHSRSKSPINSSHMSMYKSGPSASSSLDRYRGGPSEKERVLFRGPEGSISYDKNELKKISVDIIRKTRGPVEENVRINRAITNPEDIVIHRPGVGRPMALRPEYENSRDRMAEEYRRVIALDSERERLEREREKVRPRDIHYSPPHFEERPRMYYPNDRERPRSPGPVYSGSRRSPPRDFFDMREKALDERPGRSKDDLRHELELRKRDAGRFPDKLGSFEQEKESDLRTRIIEKRIEMPLRYEDRGFERERRREMTPPRERRRGSIELVRPREPWERDQRMPSGVERTRKRSVSMERPREDLRMRGNGRFEHFDEIEDRRRFPDMRDHKSDGYIPSSSLRGRGGPIRRGRAESFRGSSRGRPFLRGSPRGYRGSSFSSRGGPPRGSSMRGGFFRK